MQPVNVDVVAALLWKPAVLAACAALGSLAWRTPAMRHALWTSVLGGMLAMPALMFLVPPVPVLSSPPPLMLTNPFIRLPSPGPGITMSMRVVSPPTFPRPPVRSTPLPLAALAYCAIAGVLLLRLAYTGHRTRVLVSRAEVVVNHEAEPLAAALSLPWPLPALRESAAVPTPAVTGHSRPVILLPLDWRNWPPEKLRAVLAHELAHVRRNDWAITLAAEINRCLFWFHPLAWWLPRHLSTLAERACDELAVSITGDAPAYAEALLDVASRHQSQPAVGLAMARSSNVGRRIERVLSLRALTAAPLSRLGWTALLACALPILVTTAALHLMAQPQAIHIPDPLYQSPAPTAEQVVALEKQLLAKPDDQATRLKLATYYLLNVMREERVRHVFWFIERHPESALHSHSALRMSPHFTPSNSAADYEHGSSLWNRQVELHPNDPAVLLNAARFHVRGDAFAAERLLNRIRRLDSTHPDALGDLVSLYADAISEDMEDFRLRPAPFRPDPAFVKHAREFVESTTEAVFPGRVGIQFTAPIPQLAGMPPLPESMLEHRRRLDEYGSQLLRRARDLDPENAEWRATPPRLAPPGFAASSEQLPFVTSTAMPTYPPLALQARIQGVVRMKAAIGADGLPTSLALVGGHPVLVPAAMEATRLSRHPEQAGKTIIIEVPFRLP